MSDEAPKTGPNNAKSTRIYTVLEKSTELDGSDNWTEVGEYSAKDEKEARWLAVDGVPELAARVAGDDDVVLVAISDRNWTPKLTAEEAVVKKQRT